MYSVSQAARAAGVSVSTIRQWAREFAEHLSPGATPPKGQPRQFDEEDIAIFQTAAVLRGQLVGYDEIAERIAAGERLEPMPGDRPALDEDEAEEETSTPAAAAFSEALALYDRQLVNLQKQLLEAHDRLLDAEKRATAAETELRLIKAQQVQEEPTEVKIEAPGQEEVTELLSQVPAERRGLRRRLADWISGEK